MSRVRIDAVVPTLGASAWLEPALAALLGQRGVDLSVLLVEQRMAAGPVPAGVRRLPATAGRGFAAAINAGLASSDAPLVALVNDDAVVEGDWLERLVEALLAAPELAAVQGTNLERPACDQDQGTGGARLDGVGLTLNRWWQPIQIGHQEPVAAHAPRWRDGAPLEVLGVSATAALYRRDALERVRLPTGYLDERLESYYEDAELSVRLRAAGWAAAWVPGAAVVHAGAASSGAADRTPRAHLLVRNRPLIVARLLGRRFPLALPRLLARDLADARPGGKLRPSTLIAGWAAAARQLPGFVRSGRPAIDATTLYRLGAEAAQRALHARRR